MGSGFGQQRVHGRILEQECHARSPKRQTQLERSRQGRQQLAIGPGQDRARRSVGQGCPEEPFDRAAVHRRVRGEHEPAGGAGPRHDLLREPLGIAGDQADCTRDDRARAAVIGDEVDPPQARQRVGHRQDAPDIGQSPAVDRLVVVTDQEDAMGRRGQPEGQLELAPIDILDLVHEQVAADRPPLLESGGVLVQ